MKKLSFSPSYDLVLFNSQELKFKSPYGATPCNSTIVFNIYIHKSVSAKNIILHLIQDNKSDFKKSKTTNYSLTYALDELQYEVWQIFIKTPKIPKLLFYYFEIIGTNTFYYGNNKLLLGGEGEIYFTLPNYYQITTYYENHAVPSWFKKSIAYQIFPDRFYNDKKYILNPKKNSFIYGNWNDTPLYIKEDDGTIKRWDFFGGNLDGINKKITYLKSLNIDLIYLNPIFKSASNHRYDTGDYHSIDPILGDEKDFISLIDNCKNNKIKVILDGVFNHTGKDSIYFNYYKNYSNIGAFNSKNSPFFSWYRFKDYPNIYESWWGIEDLPCTNEINPSFLDFIIENKDSVLNHWFSKGIYGWRLDVADELPSYFIEKFKYKCREVNKESVIIGEVWEDASNKISYNQRREYFNGLQLDSVMNYPLRKYLLDFFKDKINSETLCLYMNSLKENYPEENYYSLFNLLSSHDVERIKTTINDKLKDSTLLFTALKSLSLIQFTLPGIPVIYYGDEVGVEGGKDPDNRRTYPWGKEDISLLNWYKKITSLRKNLNVLTEGDINFFNINSDIFGYFRFEKNTNDFILIMWNKNIEISYNFQFNLKDFFPVYSKNIASELYQWNVPLNIPIDSSTNFPIKIPPLETVLFSNKIVQKAE